MIVISGLSLEAAVWLLLLALAVAATTKRFDIPYTVALVIVGLALGFWHNLGLGKLGGSINLTQSAIFLLFLPPLLFQAAIEIRWQGLKLNLWHVLALAVAGVFLNLLLVGCSAHWLLGVPLSLAFLFGAIVGATDPTAVVALFRDLRVNRRLTLLIEAESLLNDGVAATIFLIVVTALAGTAPTPWASLALFVREAVGGAAAGAFLGWIMSFVTGHLDDLLIETALTLVLAYGSYLVADHLHLSGMLSVVTAGIVVGNHGLPNRVHPEIRPSIERFWEFAAFIANSLLFLLIGFKTALLAHLFNWTEDILLTAIILACRALVVFVLLSITGWRGEKVPRRWQGVLTWGGLRGAVSIALVLGLPSNLPGHDQLLGWVFATTLISLLVQGPTVKPLLRWLRVPMEEKNEGSKGAAEESGRSELFDGSFPGESVL